MIEKKIVGAMVAVATPFNEDYSIDYSSFEDNIKFMTNRGLTEGNSTLLIEELEENTLFLMLKKE